MLHTVNDATQPVRRTRRFPTNSMFDTMRCTLCHSQDAHYVRTHPCVHVSITCFPSFLPMLYTVNDVTQPVRPKRRLHTNFVSDQYYGTFQKFVNGAHSATVKLCNHYHNSIIDIINVSLSQRRTIVGRRESEKRTCERRRLGGANLLLRNLKRIICSITMVLVNR